MPESHERLHAVVHGRVQGVSFRYYTTERARQLGLRGWVRNRPDGTVEVLAEGPRPALSRLHTFLQHGPPAAQVQNVSAEWLPAAGGLAEFDVTW